MVEVTAKNEETSTESRPQNERSTKVFSSHKIHIWPDTWGNVSVQVRFNESVCYERKYGKQ